MAPPGSSPARRSQDLDWQHGLDPATGPGRGSGAARGHRSRTPAPARRRSSLQHRGTSRSASAERAPPGTRTVTALGARRDASVARRDEEPARENATVPHVAAAGEPSGGNSLEPFEERLAHLEHERATRIWQDPEVSAQDLGRAFSSVVAHGNVAQLFEVVSAAMHSNAWGALLSTEIGSQPGLDAADARAALSRVAQGTLDERARSLAAMVSQGGQ